MSDRDLVEVWCEQNKAYSFEGDSGLAKMEKLVGVLGYTGSGFKFGSPIEQFLSDNPGACSKIVEFISEWTERNEEWRQALADETGADEEEGEEDDDPEDGPPDSSDPADRDGP